MSFDWTAVEGYREDMTPDEKLALLENYTAPTPEPAPDPEPAKPEQRPGYILKKDFDKVASELAAAKKQLRAKMTDAEQQEADRLAELDAKEEELKALRREKTLSGYNAAFLGLGYDAQLAESAATSLADGDMDSVFAAMKKQATATEKALRAQILKETPAPPSDDDPNSAEKAKKDREKLRGYFGLT